MTLNHVPVGFLHDAEYKSTEIRAATKATPKMHALIASALLTGTFDFYAQFPHNLSV